MYTIEINKLRLKENETLDNIIDKVEISVNVFEENFWKSVTLPEPDAENFIALENITDDIVKTWVWENLNLEEIDNMLLSREKEKASTALKQQDPETSEVSYTFRDHVKQWKIGKDYVVDDICYYEWEEQVDTGEVDGNGDPILNTVQKKKFFRCVQVHTSQAGWNPRDTASLFTDIVYFGDESVVGYPDWQQPQGDHDAYPFGRIVDHNGTLYQSDVDANVWEPPEQWSIYSTEPSTSNEWTIGTDYVVDDVVAYNGTEYVCISAHTAQAGWDPDTANTLWEVNTQSGGTIEAWVQPSGAQDAYNTGDQVTHNGSTWESDVDGNVWEPPTQWTKV